MRIHFRKKIIIKLLGNRTYSKMPKLVVFRFIYCVDESMQHEEFRKSAKNRKFETNEKYRSKKMLIVLYPNLLNISSWAMTSERRKITNCSSLFSN